MTYGHLCILTQIATHAVRGHAHIICSPDSRARCIEKRSHVSSSEAAAYGDGRGRGHDDAHALRAERAEEGAGRHGEPHAPAQLATHCHKGHLHVRAQGRIRQAVSWSLYSITASPRSACRTCSVCSRELSSPTSTMSGCVANRVLLGTC